MEEHEEDTTTLRLHFPMKSTIRVYINISGLIYETRYKTLRKFPTTKLGDHRKLSQYFCPHRNEFYFDRHRESFSSILFFYQSSGKLYRPENINLKIFLDECLFFELPGWAINEMKRKEGGFVEDELSNFFKPKRDNTQLTLRQRLWNFFDDPTSSPQARYFAYLSMSFLFTSIVINCLKTVDEIRPATESEDHHHDGWEISDIFFNVYFLIEFVIRLIITPNRISFFKSVLVWIDFIALVTFIPLLNKHYVNNSAVLFFTPFQLFRVIRVIRLAKLFPQYNVTEIILKDCLGYFKMFAIWLLFASSLAAIFMYTLEYNETGSKFRSVLDGLYWSVQTAVTLGYGDIYPTSYMGKLFATLFILTFVPTLCLPSLTLLVRFAKFYEFAKVMADT